MPNLQTIACSISIGRKPRNVMEITRLPPIPLGKVVRDTGGSYLPPGPPFPQPRKDSAVGVHRSLEGCAELLLQWGRSALAIE